jgi:hypothetical protein
MKRNNNYRVFVYEVRLDNKTKATFCCEADAIEYAAKNGMTVYKVGAIK